MSLIVRPPIRIIRKISQYFNTSNWTNSLAVTSSRRSFHQSCILFGEGIPLRMPSLSPTMEEGKIVTWLKEEGDPVQPGDVICDIETDKAVVSFEVDEEGVLAKILVPKDTSSVKVGTVIAVMAPEGEDWKTIDIPADGGAASPAASAAAGAPSAAISTSVTAAEARKYGPSVRLLLEQYGLPSSQLQGSGPHGELLKGDVLKHIQQAGLVKLPAKTAPSPVAAAAAVVARPAAAAAAAPVAAGPYTDTEVTSMRRTIAKRLSQSKGGIAHSYGTIECRIDSLLALRKKFRKENVAVSVNDLLVKAVAVALSSCPSVNCVWQGDTVVQSATIDVSVAVATPSGLITPIVRNADQLGVKIISDRVREMAGRAKEGKLKLDEFQGGTFTISNLGMFGVSEFSAIINPPQCGILAVGGSKTVIGLDGGPETRMRATLSYDRLAIDDDAAAEFLAALSDVIQSPNQLLLGAARGAAADHPMASLL